MSPSYGAGVTPEGARAADTRPRFECRQPRACAERRARRDDAARSRDLGREAVSPFSAGCAASCVSRAATVAAWQTIAGMRGLRPTASVRQIALRQTRNGRGGQARLLDLAFAARARREATSLAAVTREGSRPRAPGRRCSGCLAAHVGHAVIGRTIRSTSSCRDHVRAARSATAQARVVLQGLHRCSECIRAACAATSYCSRYRVTRRGRCACGRSSHASTCCTRACTGVAPLKDARAGAVAKRSRPRSRPENGAAIPPVVERRQHRFATPPATVARARSFDTNRNSTGRGCVLGRCRVDPAASRSPACMVGEGEGG